MKSLFSFLFFVAFATTVSFAQTETTTAVKNDEAKPACCAKTAETKSCCSKGSASASSCKGDKASASAAANTETEEQVAPTKVVRRVSNRAAVAKKAND